MTAPHAYLMQRISALVMAPMVLAHLGMIVYAVRGGLTAEEILSRTQGSVGWAAFYTLFVAAAALHASIGMRNVLVEWTPMTKRPATIVSHVLGLVILLLGLRAVHAVVA